MTSWISSPGSPGFSSHVSPSDLLRVGAPPPVVSLPSTMASCNLPGESWKKSPITPNRNRNPTYNKPYLVDILVLTIGIHPQIWAWGYMLGLRPNFYERRVVSWAVGLLVDQLLGPWGWETNLPPEK